ncbi:MAG: hypothetical protein O6928_11060 [Gammaproteobacteria bacterium]|nr:hypothetical protein [Gammaproteobacteria bacterium]
MRYIICLAMIGFCVTANAAWQPFKLGIDLPEADVFDDMSCRDLYREATRYEPRAQNVRSPLFNEQTDLYATAIGIVFGPALYYYGLYIPWSFRVETRIHQTSQLLDTIRQRMASLQCFVK